MDTLDEVVALAVKAQAARLSAAKAPQPGEGWEDRTDSGAFLQWERTRGWFGVEWDKVMADEARRAGVLSGIRGALLAEQHDSATRARVHAWLEDGAKGAHPDASWAVAVVLGRHVAK